ncbi:MAG: hypothetical protein LE169_05975 [Endomicrobium sp.]|nr:hypothetical protein [Endomicrobium sp.]
MRRKNKAQKANRTSRYLAKMETMKANTFKEKAEDYIIKEVSEVIIGDPKTICFSGRDLTINQEAKLEKMAFSFSRAYPMLIDGLCHICTNYEDLSVKYGRQIIQLTDVENALYYMVDLPFEDFLDYALDGNRKYRGMFMKEMYLMEKNPQNNIRYVPISGKEFARMAPFHIMSIHKSEDNMEPSEIRRLSNISGRDDIGDITLKMPKERIQILFAKALFRPIINPKAKGAKGGYFLLPKGFQSKINEIMPKNDFADPIDVRQCYNYYLLHDNSSTKETTIDLIDLLKSVDPQQLSFFNGRAYFRDEKRAVLMLEVIHWCLCLMAKDGLMDNVKMVPTTVEKGSEKGKYIIGIARGIKSIKSINTTLTNELFLQINKDIEIYKEETERKKRLREQHKQSQLLLPFE